MLRTTCLCLLVLCTVVPAQSIRSDAVEDFFGNANKTIAGIDGVFVFTAGLNKPELANLGLSDDWSRELVELRLRRNGIKVLSRDEWVKAPGNPEIVIAIDTMEHTTVKGFFADTVRVAFVQRVSLDRSPATKLLGTTWENSSFGMAGNDKLKSQLRDAIEDKVDSFSNVYLKENPTK